MTTYSLTAIAILAGGALCILLYTVFMSFKIRNGHASTKEGSTVQSDEQDV